MYVRKLSLLSVILLTGILQLKAQISQTAVGLWLGNLVVNESVSIRLGFEVSEAKSGELQAIFHSLDQGAFDIPVKSTRLYTDSIFLNIEVLDAKFSGRFADSLNIAGIFAQRKGRGIDLTLTRVSEFPVKKPKRPQEPQRPYPYTEELVEVKIMEAEGVTLAGTLTIPQGEGPFPAVVLISGSGPNDRDATIFGHKVFLVLADYLTRNGIAVLRADDRGANESTGDFHSADIVTLGNDVIALFHFLKNHNKICADKIGVLGHSLGANIAPVATVNENQIAFAVLLAGSAESLAAGMLEQSEIIYKQFGVSDAGIALNAKYLHAVFEIVRQDIDLENAKKQFYHFREDFEKELEVLSEEDLEILELKPPLSARIIREFMTPAMKKDLFMEPGDYLKLMKCPTLILNGDKDVQVPLRHLYLSHDLIMSNGNKQVTAKKFVNKNHLFQSSETGKIDEYKEIEETMSPEVLEFIANWILNTGNNK
ncbi:MAG: alpha/beta hydrolase [Lentimicrobiaceae bacterium]|nr:alpha/beta hydrolase [Lentimicrobiaceae bacterium]